MRLLAHETAEDANASAVTLQSLGRHARKLMAECVEHQELTRTKLSAAARALNDAGFLFIREIPAFLDVSYELSPSLLGEEALEALEELEAAAQPARAPKRKIPSNEP